MPTKAPLARALRPATVVSSLTRDVPQDYYNTKKDRFDISKLPDIYDCIVYDVLHNQRQLNLRNLRTLYEATKPLADYVVPQEYGITEREKRKIAVRICRNLVAKILRDIEMATGRGGNADFAEQLYRYARLIGAESVRAFRAEAPPGSHFCSRTGRSTPGWTRGSPTPSRSARPAAASARGSTSPPSRTSTRCSTCCGSGAPTCRPSSPPRTP